MFGRGIGAPEIILILVIILIFFGVGKLPQVGSALGKGMRAFRRGQTGDDSEVDDAEEVPVAQKPQKAASVKKAASK